MTADLDALGYTDQISIDFSSVVIEKMQSQYPSLDWRIMDIRSMTFDDNSVDVAIDKGTLDAMLYGSLWDPEPEVKTNVGKYADEVREALFSYVFSSLLTSRLQVARILKPGGVWLFITWRQPHFIKPLLKRDDVWTLNVETIPQGPDGGGVFEYLCFVMRKHETA